ncbi:MULTISPECIES: TonB-dependent receptor [unclassified Sphingomonas]|uniref:TonB-dependent receptor n=1 Tax=unclassified Sphingomonas TaxID=196159 RepID=UPI001AC18A79|nr:MULTISPECIES: TonB-dependent receptor [unclassified Sphingomonas]MBN8849872.1 TonB-dependent receptor [Sphingomonas sp.]
MRKFILRPVMLAILGAAAVPFHAQEALAQDAQAAQPVLPDIVVTAQKREQSLQNVPIAVSALSGADLRNSGVVGMQAVAALVPSLAVVQTDSMIAQSYRLRGIGSDANIPTFEPDVGLFIDGVYMPRSGLGVDDLVDVARLEVLKGPQSTLYGKNVTAGVVNIVTEGPSHSFEGHVDASLSTLHGGSDALVGRLAGSISGPLSDAARFRISGVWYDQGATTRNLIASAGNTNDMKRYVVRGQLEIDLAARTHLLLTAARAKVYDTRGIDPELYLGPVASYLDAALGPSFGVKPCPDNNPSDRIICTDSPARASSENNILSATLTSSLGSNTLTAITAWSNYKSLSIEGDIDQLQLPVAAQNDLQTGKTFTQEVRLASPSGGRLEWMAGGYYLHSSFERGDRGRTPEFTLLPAAAYIPLDASLPDTVVLGQNGDLGFLDSRASSDYGAVFGQTTLKVASGLSLTAGLRWQTETKKASINNTFDVAPNPALIGTDYEYVNLITAVLSSPAGNGDYRHHTDGFTWTLTADYKPSNDVMLYATWARGSKSGGFNIGFGSAPSDARPFGDEKVDNYEAGAKFDFAGKRGRVALAAFHTVYDNYQNAGFIGLQFLVNNAKKVTVDGVEADGSFAVARGLTFNAGATWLDARYDNYLGGACYFGRAPDSLPVDGVFTACDLSGSQLPYTARFKATAGLDFERSTGFGAIYGRLDGSWSSRVLTDATLDPSHVQKPYALVNMRVGARFGEGFDLSVWSNNLFNHTVILVDGTHNLITDGSFQRYLGAPREIGVTLRKTF